MYSPNPHEKCPIQNSDLTIGLTAPYKAKIASKWCIWNLGSRSPRSTEYSQLQSHILVPIKSCSCVPPCVLMRAHACSCSCSSCSCMLIVLMLMRALAWSHNRVQANLLQQLGNSATEVVAPRHVRVLVPTRWVNTSSPPVHLAREPRDLDPVATGTVSCLPLSLTSRDPSFDDQRSAILSVFLLLQAASIKRFTPL